RQTTHARFEYKSERRLCTPRRSSYRGPLRSMRCVLTTHAPPSTCAYSHPAPPETSTAANTSLPKRPTSATSPFPSSAILPTRPTPRATRAPPPPPGSSRLHKTCQAAYTLPRKADPRRHCRCQPPSPTSPLLLDSA